LLLALCGLPGIEMLDVLGELGATPPWLYRGWLWIFSRSYRATVRSMYRCMSNLARGIDATLSFAFFAGEIGLAIYLILLAAENV
jgi:hypothetical protein